MNRITKRSVTTRIVREYRICMTGPVLNSLQGLNMIKAYIGASSARRSFF